MKHTTAAKITYLNDIKPNPAANMNMLPSNNRIIEIMLTVCLRITILLFFQRRLFQTDDLYPI
jgi:hypothetical protein